MRAFLSFWLLLMPLYAGSDTPANQLWNDLKALRDLLPGLHQEFDVSRTYRLPGATQSRTFRLIIDGAKSQWREMRLAGTGTTIRLFDGKDLFLMDESGEEFARPERNANDGDPAPAPYASEGFDWSKAVEVERRPCGDAARPHPCILLRVPLKPWSHRGFQDKVQTMLEGTEQILLDLETGLVMSRRTVQSFETKNYPYISDITYTLRRERYGVRLDANLFSPPSSGVREVKELSPWNVARIRKHLLGKAVPDVNWTDLQRKPLTLSSFRGKTVLLDFWATWCAPCRADAPDLEKLYLKYGDQKLVVIGVAVDEDRLDVEKFLAKNPHTFPTVLTSENQLPKPFHTETLPTYVVIDRNGTVMAVIDGGQGPSGLRKLLRKAGLEVD